MSTTIIKLDAFERGQAGTGPARAVRREGFVPAVLYGDNKEPLHLKVEERLLIKELHQSGFYTKLFDLKVGSKNYRTIARAVQLHPVSDRPLHVDFMHVGKEITLSIPLHVTNEEKCPGIKKGGVLNLVHHTVEVACDPNHIPEFLEIDLSTADIGFVVHQKDMALPKGMRFVHAHPDETLATIVPPKVQEAAAETEEAK
jgi:large subunit ribosomal protein L25